MRIKHLNLIISLKLWRKPNPLLFEEFEFPNELLLPPRPSGQRDNY